MYDYKPIDHDGIREKISYIQNYWEHQPTDNPFTLNGFDGTWNFSDHRLIPESLRNFILESFPKIEKFRRIPLEDINKLMNDVWEGPGSMVKIQKLYNEMRAERYGKVDVGVKTRLPVEDFNALPDIEEEDED